MASRRKRASDTKGESDPKRVKTLDHGKCELLETGNFSDFTIASNGFEFKVHRACLAGVSPYFDGVIDSGLSESIEQRLILDHEKPEAVFLIIWYIYTKTYPAMKYSGLEWSEDCEDAFLRAAPKTMSEFKSHVFLPHLEVYKMAELMMLPNLQRIAYKELQKQMLDFPKDVHDDIKSEDADAVTWAKSKDFQEAIRMVYMTPDTNLSTLKEFFAWGSVLNESGYKGRGDLGDIAKNINAFGWDLYVERDDYGIQNPWACRHCHITTFTVPNLLVLEDEHNVKIFICKCWYWGFCRDDCKTALEAFQDRIPLYCQKCSTGSRKPWSFDYVKRTEEGLELVTDGSVCRLYAKNVFHRVPNLDGI